jgi:hypothetical protein
MHTKVRGSARTFRQSHSTEKDFPAFSFTGRKLSRQATQGAEAHRECSTNNRRQKRLTSRALLRGLALPGLFDQSIPQGPFDSSGLAAPMLISLFLLAPRKILPRFRPTYTAERANCTRPCSRQKQAISPQLAQDLRKYVPCIAQEVGVEDVEGRQTQA